MAEQPDVTNPYSPPRAQDSREPSLTGEFAEGLIHPIYAQGTLSLEEGQQIQRLTGSGPLGRVVGFLVVAMALMLLFSLFLGNLDASKRLPGIVIVISVLAVGTLAMLLGPRAQVRRQWKRQAGIFQPQEFCFAEDELLVGTHLVETRLKWKAFSQFKCDEHLVLVYLNPPTSFFAVPRSFFESDEDWLAFLRLVERQVSSQQSRK